LHSQSNLPWALIGDFNEILYSFEKEGGNPRPETYMQAFRDVLNDCNLEDMGYSGDIFTWRRGRIRERLDRALVNEACLTMHPDASLQHLDCMRSDHRPILLETEQQLEVLIHGKKFFEAKWLREESFRSVVEQAWARAEAKMTDGGVLAKLAHMHSTLHAWDADVLKQPKQHYVQHNRNWNEQWRVL
jgi:hypothetical protein